MGNEKPIFKLKGVHLDSFDILKDSHVKWNFSKEKTKLKVLALITSENTKRSSLKKFFPLKILNAKNSQSILHWGLIVLMEMNPFNL